MQTTIGRRLIYQLACNGLKGHFFDRDAYRRLEKIDSVNELKKFLRQNGWGEIVVPSHQPERIVRQFAAIHRSRCTNRPWGMALMHLLPLLPAAFLLLDPLSAVVVVVAFGLACILRWLTDNPSVSIAPKRIVREQCTPSESAART